MGSLSPALRQRAGGKELLYHRVQAAYRALLAQVGQPGQRRTQRLQC